MSRARILADYVSSGDELALKAPLISPALVTPNLGTPSAGTMTNVTGMPLAGLSATGTASSSTFLRGDNSWNAAGSSDASSLTSGTLGNTVQDNITRIGTVTDGTFDNNIGDNATFPSSYLMSGSSTNTTKDALVAGSQITMQNTHDTDGNFAGSIKALNSSGGNIAAIQCSAKLQGSEQYAEWWFYTSNGAAPTLTGKLNDGGNWYVEGTVNAPTAMDFAEYFEWEDGNLNEEYRAGESVVLVGNKVKIATGSDEVNEIVGVISETAGLIVGGADFHWQGQYIKDDFGKKTGEINPDYDKTKEYIERSERKEWTIVGLLGQIAIKKTAPKRPTWIKLRDISDEVEQWLVR